MSNHKDIINKIKKCLALSASSNEHEAEAALRQARKLMEGYGITDSDILASEIEERRAAAGTKKYPPNWETVLAVKVGETFGCELIFTDGAWHQKGTWDFIGCGAAPEVAQYAFTVLRRQAKRAREEHIKEKLRRCKASRKTRRADLFSDGWVLSVVDKIKAFAGNEQQTAAIKAYMAKNYPSLKEDLKSRDRNENRTLSSYEYNDYTAGKHSGSNAQLNRGVGGSAAPLKLT